MMKLTPENKATWLQALNTHSKAKSSLVATTNNCSSYCCLGVAGKVLLGLSDDILDTGSGFLSDTGNAVIENPLESNHNFSDTVVFQDITVDDEMFAYANAFYSSRSSDKSFVSYGSIERFLGNLNDATETFKEVKDFITKYL